MNARNPPPDISLERAVLRRLGAGARVAGVDEAGRGSWAGPVAAAAVVLGPGAPPRAGQVVVNDSKKLDRARREALFAAISESCEVGVGLASAEEIDRLDILRATFLAMRRALAALPRPPDHALIDGRDTPPGLACPAEAVIGGDGRSLSIAAASIVAKVTRDRIMADLALIHPEYGWDRNAGYGVEAHRVALLQHSVTPYHRRSFRPIHKMLC